MYKRQLRLRRVFDIFKILVYAIGLISPELIERFADVTYTDNVVPLAIANAVSYTHLIGGEVKILNTGTVTYLPTMPT